MRKSPKFSPEVMERAVRMVFDAKDQYPSQWAAIESIAGKIGCTAETLRARRSSTGMTAMRCSGRRAAVAAADVAVALAQCSGSFHRALPAALVVVTGAAVSVERRLISTR
jgi:transposase-like protein